MRIQELRQFTGISVRKEPKAVRRTALLYPALWLVMKLVPDVLALAVLVKTPETPGGLFFGRNRFWVLFVMLWGLLRFCILTPVLCKVCNWFSCHLGLGKKAQGFFTNRKLFRKSLRFFGVIEIMRFLSLCPFVLSCVLMMYAFHQGSLSEEAGFWLFLMIQGMAGAVWSGLFYVRFCVNLLEVPFLFLENPERSAIGAVRESGNMLRHQHGKLVWIFLTNFLPAHAVTMLMLFLQIRIREFIQEKGEVL